MWVLGKEICVSVVLVIAYIVCAVKADCGEIPPVDHVGHNLTNVNPPYPRGTVASLSCQRGFTQSGFPYKVCGDNDTWTIPSGYPPFQCRPKSCGDPGAIRNGEKDSYVYTVGQTVGYSCYEGFEMVGRDTTLCLASGSWSVPAPTCNAIQCPVIQSPTNGYLVGSDRGYDSTIRFECSEGFTPAGPNTAKCQLDKTWTNQPFECQEIDCGPPPEVANAVVTLQGGTTWGESARVRCFENATSSSDLAFNTIFCGDAGDWTRPPECMACCRVAPVHNDTSVAFIRGEECVPHGETRDVSLYSCDEGFYIPNPVHSVRCQRGVMSANITCLPIMCEIPEVEFGRVVQLEVGQVVEYGRKMAVECDRGYNLTSASTVVCNSSVSYPSCEPACCRVVPVHNDTSVAFIRGEECVPHGETRDVSLYSCDEGFYIPNPVHSVRCQRGVMSANVTCLPIMCEIPEVEFGRVLQLEVGQVVEYSRKMAVECDRGYNLTSASTVVCNSSVSYPSCEPACCRVAPVHDDTSVAFIRGEECVPHGETRDVSLYSCDEGFYIPNPVHSVRCQRGVMSANVTCLPIVCKVPEIEFGRVLQLEVGQVVEYGRKMTVECDRGYNLTSASTVVCNRRVSYPSCWHESCSVASLPHIQISSVESTCLTFSDQYVANGCEVNVACEDSSKVVKGTCDFGQWHVENCHGPIPPWVIVVCVIGGLLGVGCVTFLVVYLAKNSKKLKLRSGASKHHSEVIGLHKK
ncbi:sushi, von Willebrand factor type A, EGF and pentraxin domain-containing protein 1-like [Liolophura sinensis]|uniref:sushi, von Willebrand factor type A, EGF and pentraxin domain-containing protein 1-like n=1 Tax=Liolophura sinensis TaxID=3198878 RepID=UPI003158F2C3